MAADPATHAEFDTDLAPELNEDEDPSCDPVDESSPAEPLFGGGRFMFWALGPVSVCAGLSLLLTIDGSWSIASAMRLLLGACSLLFALALLSPRRFDPCARAVTAIVFGLCAMYLVEMCLQAPTTPATPTRPGNTNLPNAIRAMLVFGLPSLWFTVRRRRRQR